MTALAPRCALAAWQQRSAIIAASSEDSAYPAANLYVPRLSQPWRSAAGVVTSVNVDIDLGSSVPIQCVWLLATNLSDAATMRHKFSDTALGNTDKWDSGTVNVFDLSLATLQPYAYPWGRHLAYYPNPSITARYVRIVLNDSGNVDGYLRGCYPGAEQIWQPAINFDANWNRNPDFVGDFGAQAGLRHHTLTFHRLTVSESSQLQSLWNSLLNVGRILVNPQPTKLDHFVRDMIWCTVPKFPTTVPVDRTGKLWTSEVEFVEVDE